MRQDLSGRGLREGLDDDHSIARLVLGRAEELSAAPRGVEPRVPHEVPRVEPVVVPAADAGAETRTATDDAAVPVPGWGGRILRWLRALFG